MKTEFLKNYGSTFALSGGLVVGALCGAFFPSATAVMKPVGDIFLNLLFVLIVPLVFFGTSASICNMRESGMLGRVFVTVAAVFTGMSLIAALLAYAGCLVFNPLGTADLSAFAEWTHGSEVSGTASVSDAIVSTLTVPDLNLLLSKSSLLPLILIAALAGYAVSASEGKGRAMRDFILSANEVNLKMMTVVMKAAPVGLGCYFASIIQATGGQLLGGYARVFALDLVLCLILYFGLHSVYVSAFAGLSGLKKYWACIIAPSVMAVATSSSAATMPSAIAAAKKMGVSDSVADSVIPLGVNLHKDGSVVAGVLKVVFLMCLCSRDLTDPATALAVLAVAILSAVVLGAIPGGGLAGEIFICSIFGLGSEMVGILVVIATIVDIAATLVNSTSNVVGAMVVDRLCSHRADSNQ